MIRRLLFVVLISGFVSLSSSNLVHAANSQKISKDQKNTFSVAMKAMREGNYPKARKNFQSLLQARPDWGLVHLQLGQLALDTDADTQRAISHLHKACKLNPDNPRAHHQLGIAHQLGGNCSQALKSFDKAIALRKTYIAAHLSKAQCLERTGKTQAALISLEDILNLRRNHEGALSNLARLYEASGMPEKAQNMLTRLTEIQPKAFPYFQALGFFYQRQGKLEAASKAFNKANALNPRKRRKMRPLPKSHDAP